MYSSKNTVKYSEIGENKHVPLYQIVNYFQNCTSLHSESLGAGIDFYKKWAWILASWQIIIEEYPRITDSLITSTWAHSFKEITAARNFTLKDESGKMLAYANSIWTFIDTETGHPIKVTKEEAKTYGIEEPMDMDYAPRKIRLPKELTTIDTIPVRHFQIDTHGHMNNSQYVMMCEEYIPSDFIVASLRVEYKRSATFGTILTIRQGISIDSHTYLFELQDQENTTLAVLEFKGNYIC